MGPVHRRARGPPKLPKIDLAFFGGARVCALPTQSCKLPQKIKSVFPSTIGPTPSPHYTPRPTLVDTHALPVLLFRLMPAKKLTDGVIASIAHDHYELGKSTRQIAQERDLHRNTIQTALRKFREPAKQETTFSGTQREILEQKSYTAIEHGLNADDDPYKRADVGFKYLRGVGVFGDDESKREVNIHIQNLVNGVPEEWHERYLGTVEVIEATAVEDPNPAVGSLAEGSDAD
jgi:hypothetical protein